MSAASYLIFASDGLYLMGMSKIKIDQNRIGKLIRGSYTVILILAAIMFVGAVRSGPVEGEAHIGKFYANEITSGWSIEGPNGEMTENVSLPASVYSEEGLEYKLRNTLPPDVRAGMHLCIHSVRQDVTVYIDGEKREYYGKDGFAVKRKSAVSALVLVDLTDEDAGAPIEIDIVSNSFGTGKVDKITYAYGNNVWFPYIVDNLALVITAVVLVVAGLAAIISFLIVRRRVLSSKGLFYMGQLMVVTGLWILSESTIRQLIFKAPSKTNVFSFILISILAPFGAMFFNELQENRFAKVYRALAGVALLQLLLNTILNFTGVADYYTTLPFIHVWSACLIIWSLITDIIDIKNGDIKKYSIAAMGMMVLLVSVLWEFYRFYKGGIHTLGVSTGIGLLALLGCTAIQLVRDNIREMYKRQEQSDRMTKATFSAIAGTLDAKDEYTGDHSDRVGEYARLIAEKVAGRYGFKAKDLDRIQYIGKMHDIGKIGVPDRVLNKNEKLTPAEFDLMKKHTIVGDAIMSNIDNIPGLSEGVRNHHERWDGTGYPDRLKGEEIPLIARILCLADSYDAMTSDRIYRSRLPKEKVVEEIETGKGTQFDPELAEVVLRMIRNSELTG